MAALRVFFITNRNHQPDNKKLVFGPRFNPDGVAALRFGHAEFDRAVDGPKLKKVYVYPDSRQVDIQKTGGGSFLDDLRDRMAGERTDTLVFVHGFNVTFDGALHAAARLTQDVALGGRELNVVLFSWPSDGEAVPFMSYYSDREDARASGPALARAFLKLREYLIKLPDDKYCQRCIHVLTHSMGAYVLRHGLQSIVAKDPNSITRLFDQIMLAAPDEDDDALESDAKLRLLPRIGRQVTVYFNPNDKGLIVSDKTKTNPDRLGSDGPRMTDLIPKKVVLVDCRNVAGHADPFTEHSYYIRSRSMAQDISAVVKGAAPEAIANRQYVETMRAWRIITELPAPSGPN